jgi:hypothetical protein
MKAFLRAQVVEDLGAEERVSDEEVASVLTKAVGELNSFNPKSPQNVTLQTAPVSWQIPVQEGALTILYEERSAELKETDQPRSGRYGIYGRQQRKRFDDLAHLLMQNRPASAGSRSRRR